MAIKAEFVLSAFNGHELRISSNLAGQEIVTTLVLTTGERRKLEEVCSFAPEAFMRTLAAKINGENV